MLIWILNYNSSALQLMLVYYLKKFFRAALQKFELSKIAIFKWNFSKYYFLQIHFFNLSVFWLDNMMFLARVSMKCFQTTPLWGDDLATSNLLSGNLTYFCWFTGGKPRMNIISDWAWVFQAPLIKDLKWALSTSFIFTRNNACFFRRYRCLL